MPQLIVRQNSLANASRKSYTALLESIGPSNTELELGTRLLTPQMEIAVDPFALYDLKRLLRCEIFTVAISGIYRLDLIGRLLFEPRIIEAWTSKEKGHLSLLQAYVYRRTFHLW